MRKLIFMPIVLITILIMGGCNQNSVKQIKADYVDIGFGQSLYDGYNKVEKETVQSLVKAYNQLESVGQTNKEINYEKAITIIFVSNDQISGTLVIDDKGVFHTSDEVENYQIDSDNDIYEQAVEIYNDLKKQY